MPKHHDDMESVTIVVMQVVDYDRLMAFDEIGTTTALRALRRDLLAPLLARYAARIVQIAGDATLLQFDAALDAISHAGMMQRAMMTRNADMAPGRQIWLRLGIHLGDVVTDGNNIYGDGVDLANRLATQCAPGAICVSASIEETVGRQIPYPMVDRGHVTTGGRPLHMFDLTAAFIETLPDTAVPRGDPHLPSVHVAIREGLQLNDSYEIDRLVGKGGMGEIFRGHEIQSGDPVAIKLIRFDLVGNGPALALFQREASVLKHINHEAVVRYYMFAFDQIVRRHYLAMEFVDGPSLSKRLESGALSFNEVDALRQRVASGLQVAHERGIVHRDVSPDNIILPGSDIARAKIIDFGIARSPGIGGGTIIGGGFAGKYNYVSPEQLGLSGGDVTSKSDIYSFGLVLAEASSGAPLDMAGSQAETIEKRRTVPDLGTVDPRLRPLIAQMLQPNIPKNLAGEWLRAILTGAPYPLTLRSTILMRLRADKDVSTYRVAMLKAVEVSRKHEVPVSLDPTLKDPGYLLGRLFATYEYVQIQALGAGVNATIRDQYYGTASATPRAVFPLLQRKATHHLSRLRKDAPGRARFLDQRLGEIFELADPEALFVPTLTAPRQALFAVGYYHQRNHFYRTKPTETEAAPIEDIAL